jgi:hypothetical protein
MVGSTTTLEGIDERVVVEIVGSFISTRRSTTTEGTKAIVVSLESCIGSLETLYQTRSGRIPFSVGCASNAILLKGYRRGFHHRTTQYTELLPLARCHGVCASVAERSLGSRETVGVCGTPSIAESSGVQCRAHRMGQIQLAPSLGQRSLGSRTLSTQRNFVCLSLGMRRWCQRSGTGPSHF